MKYLVALIIGAVAGGFVVHYHDNAKFAAEVNAKADSAVQSGAESAHKELTAPPDSK